MNFIETLLPYLIPALTGVFGLFIGARTRNATDTQLEQGAKATELDNVQKALGTYREMMEDLKTNLQALNEAYDKLEKEFEEQEVIIKSYRKMLMQKDEIIENLEEERKQFFKKIKSCDFDCNILTDESSTN